MKALTLDEAYKITNKMSIKDGRKPTDFQMKAKNLIYHEVICKEYEKLGKEVPPHLEPDFFSGWK